MYNAACACAKLRNGIVLGLLDRATRQVLHGSILSYEQLPRGLYIGLVQCRRHTISCSDICLSHGLVSRKTSLQTVRSPHGPRPLCCRLNFESDSSVGVTTWCDRVPQWCWMPTRCSVQTECFASTFRRSFDVGLRCGGHDIIETATKPPPKAQKKRSTGRV